MMLTEHDVFQHRQVLHQAQVLECPADAEINALVERDIVNRLVIETDFTCRDAIDSAQQIEDGGLASAVWPDQPATGSLAHLNVEIIDHRQAAKCQRNACRNSRGFMPAAS